MRSRYHLLTSPRLLRTLRNHLTLPRKRETMVSCETPLRARCAKIRDLVGVPDSWKYRRVAAEYGQDVDAAPLIRSLMIHWREARERDITNRAKIPADDETHDIIAISNVGLCGKIIFQSGIPSCELIRRTLLTRSMYIHATNFNVLPRA